MAISEMVRHWKPGEGDALRVAVVSDEHPVRLAPLLDACGAAGLSARVVDPHPWIVDDDDVVLVRSAGREVSDRVQAMHELLPLEIRGARVVNRPSAHQIANHALLTAHALATDDVAHVRVLGAIDADGAVDAAWMLGFPVTVRTAYTGADPFVVCASPDEVCHAAERLLSSGAVGGLAVHELLPEPADVHVLVVDGDVAAASLGVARPAGRSSMWVPMSVGDAVGDLALRAVAAVGGDAMSAHVLVAADGRVAVLDVDPVPAIDRFELPAWGAVAALMAHRCATSA